MQNDAALLEFLGVGLNSRFNYRRIDKMIARNKSIKAIKIMELEECGQLATKEENSLRFVDRPVGGANWSFDCFIVNNVATATVSCNSDIRDFYGWSARARVRFSVGPYPSTLPFQTELTADFSCRTPFHILQIPTQGAAVEFLTESVDYCKIIITVEEVFGPEDDRCWWTSAKIPNFSRNHLIIKQQKFYEIPNSNYVQRLFDRDPDNECVVLRGISIDTYLTFVNFDLSLGPVHTIEDVDEAMMDKLIDAVYYFESGMFETWIVYYLKDTNVLRKFDARKVFEWTRSLKDTELKQLYSEVLIRQSPIRYPLFLRNRELGVGPARFTRQ